MKRLIAVVVLACLAAAPAFADVSNELTVGLEVDTTSEVESNFITDAKSKINRNNSLFTLQYTHFFTPLKDDGKPIDLWQFYQHPSTLSAGLTFFGGETRDNSVPGAESKGDLGGALFQVGGEYFFPTNTGLFLFFGFGGGTFDETEAGVSQPEVDIANSQIDLGVRQYVLPAMELRLRYHGESTENSQSGFPDETIDSGVVYFGGRGVIADVVGLTLEFGGGKVEDEAGGITIKSDLSAVNFEIAGYIGKHLTLRLAIAAEEEETTEAPAGVDITTTIARTTLAGKYWFSERFGMELPVYAESIEEKATFPLFGEQTLKTTNTGIGLYAAFRF
jgi:hypothetical protein